MKPGRSLALGAQAVGDPGAHAGPALSCRAGVKQQFRRGVVELLGVHRFDEGQIVGDRGDARQHVRNPGAALAAAAELLRRAEQLGNAGREGEHFALDHGIGARLAVVFHQFRFVVEHVEVGGAPTCATRLRVSLLAGSAAGVRPSARRFLPRSRASRPTRGCQAPGRRFAGSVAGFVGPIEGGRESWRHRKEGKE